jgi:hypothetical protein
MATAHNLNSDAIGLPYSGPLHWAIARRLPLPPQRHSAGYVLRWGAQCFHAPAVGARLLTAGDTCGCGAGTRSLIYVTG